MKRSKKGFGFTLIELLVVVAIIALLVSILLPAIGRARELARRTVCLTQMKAIGSGVAMYRQDNRDSFPMYPDFIDPNGDFKTSDTGPRSVPYNPMIGSPWGSAAQQNWFLLVFEGIVPEKGFVCPSSDDSVTDRTVAANLNKPNGFGAHDNVSYGIQYHGTNWTGTKGTDWSASSPILNLKDEVIIAADKGNDDDYTKNSPNHREDGQSMLHSGSHCTWSDKTDAGYKGNEIYKTDMILTSDTPPQPQVDFSAGDDWGNSESGYDTVIVWHHKP